MRFGSAVSMLDFVNLGSTLSLRSYCRLGETISVLDFVSLGSTSRGALAQFERLESRDTVPGFQHSHRVTGTTTDRS